MLTAVLSMSTRTTYIHLEVSHLVELNWVKLVQESDKSLIDTAFLHNIQVCVSSSGYVIVFQ